MLELGPSAGPVDPGLSVHLTEAGLHHRLDVSAVMCKENHVCFPAPQSHPTQTLAKKQEVLQSLGANERCRPGNQQGMEFVADPTGSLAYKDAYPAAKA
jgi:hypothetical protein